MNVYVLIDNLDNQMHDVIGVFDHSDVTDNELIPYFGTFTREAFRDIRDSSVEWDLCINTDRGDKHRLTLHEYEMNEI